MVERASKYASLAVKLAYEKMGHWARSPFLSESERVRSFQDMEDGMAEALFQGLCELRGTAAKLGQILSMESGLLPDRFRDRLQSLQHAVVPLSYGTIRKVMRHDLGAFPEDLFESFEPEAFAAASLGQVHRALTRQGESVAVKILYPGVSQSIQTDFVFARALFSPLPQNQLLLRTIQELQTRILEEVDYRRERDNMIWFRERNLDTGLVIPKVHADLCGAHVLTAEFLEGQTLSTEIPSDLEVRQKMAQSTYDFFKQSVFEWGAIHADPHAGNYLWLPERGATGLVDFGAVRRDFNPTVLKLFRAFFNPLTDDQMVELYGELGADIADLDTEGRRRFFVQVIQPYLDKVRELTSVKEYHFVPGNHLARDLRMSLVAHAFHPRLQKFSSEFSLLHRTFYGTLTLLTKLQSSVQT